MWTRIKRALGIDTRQDEYTFAHDPLAGHVATARVAEKWVKTTCGYCSVGCGMLVGVKDGKAVTVRGNPDHPVNLGKLCPKGLSEHHILDAPGRAMRPLLRKNGVLEPVSWDEALEAMIENFGQVQMKYGRDALGVIDTGQLVTEEFYTLGKLVQLGFRTRNFDGNTTLCMASAVSGYKLSFGSDGPPGSYADMESADVILLIGANIADNHPILCQRLERNRMRGSESNPATTVIVVDPRVTKTAMIADIHLPVKPRSDIALINGLAHVLIQEKLIDSAYIDAHTTGFEEFSKHVAEFTPRRVAAITGLAEEIILRVARLYGNAKAAFIGWTMGVNHSTQGAVTVAAINNLALITGNLGRAGAAPFSITGQCNAMGTREAGFTSSLPGYRKFDSNADRAELSRIWNVDERIIPTARGLAYPDIIEGAFSPSIAANYQLNIKTLGLLASSAIWMAPIGRILAGWASDRFGAPRTFAFILCGCGLTSIASAYTTDYNLLFIERVVVAIAGVSFVVGIQHVAQWFNSGEIGTAEGLYAGTGNVGAGMGALVLPRIFGIDYHSAFLWLGAGAIVIAIWYLVRGSAAKSNEQRDLVRQRSNLRDTAFVWSRYIAIALMLAYAMSFGLEIALNAWLPGYFTRGFHDAILALGFTGVAGLQIAAGTFAAVASFCASLFRPFSGFMSDLFQRKGWTPLPIIAKTLPYAPRLHWLGISLLVITAAMAGLTVAGLTGSLHLSVLVLVALGVFVSFGTGGTFALVPLLFPDRPGAAAGFIGGISTAAGIVYPLIFAGGSDIHMGYALVALYMFVPFVLFYFWAARGSGSFARALIDASGRRNLD